MGMSYVVSDTAESAETAGSLAQDGDQEKIDNFLTCPARSFHARFSLAGEMFTADTTR